MLVLETLRIGDEITVTVLNVKGQRVRLGIRAPRSLLALREVLIEREVRQWRRNETQNGAQYAEGNHL